MKIIFGICFLVTITFTTNSQSKHTVVYKNGDTIYTNNFMYKRPLLGKRHFEINGKEVALEDVKSFTTYNLPYKVERIRGTGRLLPIRQVINGRIQLFDFIRPPRNEIRASFIPPDQLTIASENILFIKDKEPLRWYTHRRFKKAVASSSEAAKAFSKASRIRTIAGLTDIASWIIITGGLIKHSVSISNTGATIAYTGLGLYMASTIYRIANFDNYRDAISNTAYIYNKEY